MYNPELAQTFSRIFPDSPKPEAFFSPGRVNLIGEHTDHEGGYVFPCAIDFGISALASKREGNSLRLYSANFDGEYSAPFEIA